MSESRNKKYIITANGCLLVFHIHIRLLNCFDLDPQGSYNLHIMERGERKTQEDVLNTEETPN